MAEGGHGMSKRFTKEHLYRVRNEIPILSVIERLSELRVELDGDYHRFSCPNCQGYHTAVNEETNLARCFECSRNYNTIDLVMACRRRDFVTAVTKLSSFFETHLAGRSRNATSGTQGVEALLKSLISKRRV